MTIREQHALRAVEEDLLRQFAGVVPAWAIDRFLVSAYDEIAETATVTKFLPLLAYATAAERLRECASQIAPADHPDRGAGGHGGTAVDQPPRATAPPGMRPLSARQARVLQAVADGRVQRGFLLGDLEPHLLDGQDVIWPLRALVLHRLVLLRPLGPPQLTRRGRRYLDSPD